jgi:predicted PurR-regulated permease PerM
MVALLVLQVPFAVPLGMWAGVADLIPMVGAYLGAAPAVVIGLINSPVQGIVVLAYFVVYQQFENYVLAPRVMRQAVDLSPAAVIISTLVGGSLLGFAGALLALPIAATLKVVLTEVWLRPREQAAGAEAPLALPPGPTAARPTDQPPDQPPSQPAAQSPDQSPDQPPGLPSGEEPAGRPAT